MEIHHLFGFFILTFLQENAHVLILNRVQKYQIEKYVQTRPILIW